MHVCKGIELIEGFGHDCNVYVVDDALIIDAGTGTYFAKMKEEIERVCDPTSVQLLVNTHCHFDHSGGNKKFRDWLKLQIAVHAADRDSVETGKGALSELFGQSSRIMTVDRILQNGSNISTKNFSFDVIHTPGHTPGSICLYDKSKKILISGDTLFDSAIGRTDYPGGSKEQMIESLKKISLLDAQYLLPGHGAPKIGGVSFLAKQMTNFLRESEEI
jgi:glyoxylase-like metal-dependent hydrolase (beta-lactamase superfamily II)